jgi:hypothetical protein
MRPSVACFRTLLPALVIAFVFAAPARGAFVILSGNGGTLAVPGQYTVPLDETVDISFYISSPDSDHLSAFQVQLQLTRLGIAGSLPFSPITAPAGMPQQPVDFLNNDPNYVFSQNSSDALPPPGFWNNTSDSGGGGSTAGPLPIPIPVSIGYANSFINGGDSALGSPTSFNPSPSYLLFTVQVYADPNLVAVGQQFRISLVPPVFDPAVLQDQPTYFNDPQPYDSGSGTITVGPSAVPAPSSVVLAAIGSLTGLLICWSRRRKSPAPVGA